MLCCCWTGLWPLLGGWRDHLILHLLLLLVLLL
jgi:hypothetical protein